MLPNCTASFFSSRQPDCTWGRATNQPTPLTTTTMKTAAAFFSQNRKQIFLNIIFIHLLHSHYHRDLDHSCPILTQHDLQLFYTPRNEHFPYNEGNFFLSTPLATLLFSNLSPEGRKSRDQGSGGCYFILEEIFTSPGPYLTINYLSIWTHTN